MTQACSWLFYDVTWWIHSVLKSRLAARWLLDFWNGWSIEILIIISLTQQGILPFFYSKMRSRVHLLQQAQQATSTDEWGVQMCVPDAPGAPRTAKAAHWRRHGRRRCARAWPSSGQVPLASAFRTLFSNQLRRVKWAKDQMVAAVHLSSGDAW